MDTAIKSISFDPNAESSIVDELCLSLGEPEHKTKEERAKELEIKLYNMQKLEEIKKLQITLRIQILIMKINTLIIPIV